jgi:hypothetical protein
MNEMALIENGWRKFEGPGGTGYMPETAKDENAWVSRCREMHMRQAAEDETGSYTDILSRKRVKEVRQNPRGATFG